MKPNHHDANADDRLDALFAQARAAAPEEHPREYGFEQRFQARLREQNANANADADAPPMLNPFWQRLAPVAPVLTAVFTGFIAVGAFSRLQEAQEFLLFTQDALSFTGLLVGV